MSIVHGRYFLRRDAAQDTIKQRQTGAADYQKKTETLHASLLSPESDYLVK
jgi:hypothetical protein